MDTILTALLNFGIGGIMAGAVLFLLMHLLKTTIPQIQGNFAKDLKYLQEQHVKIQEQHVKMMEMGVISFEKTLGIVETRWKESSETIKEKLEDISQVLHYQNEKLNVIHETLRK